MSFDYNVFYMWSFEIFLLCQYSVFQILNHLDHFRFHIFHTISVRERYLKGLCSVRIQASKELIKVYRILGTDCYVIH